MKALLQLKCVEKLLISSRCFYNVSNANVIKSKINKTSKEFQVKSVIHLKSNILLVNMEIYDAGKQNKHGKIG